MRPSIWIPSCELVWTLLTFCLAAAKTSNHVIAIRFFVGLVESIFYPAGESPDLVRYDLGTTHIAPACFPPFRLRPATDLLSNTAHFILGSWYKPSELAKRACIFHASRYRRISLVRGKFAEDSQCGGGNVLRLPPSRRIQRPERCAQSSGMEVAVHRKLG